MHRTLALATVALASVACSLPNAAAPAPQVRPEMAAHAAAPTTTPTGTPTPQPAEPTVHAPAVAAAQPGTAAPAQPTAAPGTPGARHFGAAIESGLPSVRLGQIVAAPTQYNDHPLRVEGQVVAVCQHMGCWMEIRDEQTQAHIRMHGHSFFLPRDVNGHRAAVEATLVAAHPPTECDHHAQAATAQVAPIELDATGVDVYD